MRTPWKHHANTNQKTVWDSKFGREQFKQTTEGVPAEGVPAEGVLSRRCSLQKVFSPEGVLSRRCSLQKVFSAQLWYRICVDTNRSPKPKFLNRGLGKLDPRPSLRTSVDNLQKWGTKTYLCFGNQFQSTTPFTTHFTT
jgi:hypothetical protein